MSILNNPFVQHALAYTGLRKFLLIVTCLFLGFAIPTGAPVFWLSLCICIAGLLAWEYIDQRRLARDAQGIKTFASISTSPQADTVIEQVIMALAIVSGVLGKEIPEETLRYTAQLLSLAIVIITNWRDLVKTAKLAWASFRA